MSQILTQEALEEVGHYQGLLYLPSNSYDGLFKGTYYERKTLVSKMVFELLRAHRKYISVVKSPMKNTKQH